MTLRKRVFAIEKEVMELQRKNTGYELNKKTVLGAVATEIQRLQSINEEHGLSECDIRRNAECIAHLVETYAELVKTLRL